MKFRQREASVSDTLPMPVNQRLAQLTGSKYKYPHLFVTAHLSLSLSRQGGSNEEKSLPAY